MRTNLVLIVAAVFAATAPAAHAQATAGGAWADDGPRAADPTASLPPAVRSCAMTCATNAQRCGAEAARLSGKDRDQVIAACTSVARRCAEGCAGNGGASTVSIPFPTDGAGQPDVPVMDDGDLDTNPEAAVDALVSNWTQRDGLRTAEARKMAVQLTQQILTALCGNTAAQGACVTSTVAARSTIPTVTSSHRAATRWSQPSPSPIAQPATAASTRCTSKRTPPAPGAPAASPTFIRDSYANLCLPGASCRGATSVTVNGVELTLSARTLPPSGMCVADWQQNFAFTLHAHNLTDQAQILGVRAAALETNGVPNWAGSNNIAPETRIAPGDTADLEFTSDCNVGEAVAGSFQLNVRPFSPGGGLSVSISTTPAAPPCPDLTGPSITATQGIEIPTPSGVLHQIQ